MSLALAFAITDPEGGVAYYRAAAFADMLRARGHTVVVSDAVQMTPMGRLVVALELEADRPVAWEPDVLVLTGGWPSAIDVEWIDEARANGQMIVVDVDDWPWIPADNFHHDNALPAAKLAAIARADLLTVSTPYLASRLSAHAPTDIRVWRNVVDPTLYTSARAVNTARADALARSSSSSAIRVGFRGGLAWHAGDLAILGGVLEELVERAAHEVRFVHVGHVERVTRANPSTQYLAASTISLDVPTFAAVAGVDANRVVERPLVPFRDYPASLERVDVGIVPLTTRPFALAKSNIGALEWTAAGVPWVASPNPEYERLDAASIAARRRDWLRLLLELVDDAGRRAAVLERQSVAAAEWNAGAGEELERDVVHLERRLAMRAARETTPEESGAAS